MKPFSLLIPVPNVSEGLTWYQKAFPLTQSHYLAEFDFTLLIIEDFQIEIVQADDKVNAGSAGVVLYWFTDNLNKSIQYLESLGATLYFWQLNWVERGTQSFLIFTQQIYIKKATYHHNKWQKP